MSKIVLYGPIAAPFTRKVQGALALKKLPYEFIEPQSPEDYRRWNPETGLLPLIDVDGDRVHDSAHILDLLDARFPDPPLVASDPKVAQSQRRLEQWAEAAFTFYWIHYLRGLVNADEGGPPSHPGLAGEFAQRLDDLVNFLGARPFFYADLPGRADLAVWSYLSGLRQAVGPEVADVMETRVALIEHSARVSALANG
ncbi:MAG: glutathione S-transferase family protein [bacterium]|nr:glutathione S-transferase family protein [bacterium]MCP5067537.1 glutathione S-transferase family protein [bacterium]